MVAVKLTANRVFPALLLAQLVGAGLAYVFLPSGACAAPAEGCRPTHPTARVLIATLILTACVYALGAFGAWLKRRNAQKAPNGDLNTRRR